MQRLDLGLVAAPDGGQRFEFGDDVLALEIAERVAQRDLAQPPLRRGRTIPRIRRRPVGRERILAAAHALGQPADEHGNRRLHLARHADGLEVVELVGGAGEIADLDRRAHLVPERNPLQLDRQGGDRRFDALEAVARLRPFALARIGERAPQRRVVLVADAGLARSLSASSGRFIITSATARSTLAETSSSGGRSSASATSSTPLASGYMSRAM